MAVEIHGRRWRRTSSSSPPTSQREEQGGIQRDAIPTIRGRSPPPNRRQGREPLSPRRRERPRSQTRHLIPSATFPTTRRGRERERATSPTTRRGREREGATSPTTRRGRERQRATSPTTRRGRERQRATSPTTRRGRDRRRASSPGLIHRRGRERQQPASPTICSGRERHGPFSSICGGRERYRGGGNGDPLPASSVNGHGRDGLREWDRSRSASPTTLGQKGIKRHWSGAQTSSLSSHADSNKAPSIHELSEDIIIGEVMSRLNPVDIVKLACTCRTLFRLAGSLMAGNPRTFHGVVVIHRMGTSTTIGLMNRRLARASDKSLDIIRGALQQYQHRASIVDCKCGVIVMQATKDGKIYLVNPFIPKKWLPVPMCNNNHVLGISLFFHKKRIGLIQISEEKSNMKYIVNVYGPGGNSWSSFETQINDGTLHFHSVQLNEFVYFLSKKNVVKVDPLHQYADTIHLPHDVGRMMILTSVNGSLCLASIGKGSILVHQYVENFWTKQWVHQVPKEAYWIKIFGAGNENGLVIVGTGSGQCHVLKVKDGSWIELKNHAAGDASWALEVRNPFVIPDPIADLAEPLMMTVNIKEL